MPLHAQGPVVSFRSFKHGKRSNKATAEAEFTSATNSLQEDGFGRVEKFNIPRSRGKCKVFVKSKPQEWPSTSLVTSDSPKDFTVTFRRCVCFCKVIITFRRTFKYTRNN